VLRLILVFVLFWVIARSFWRFVDGVARGAGVPPPGPRPSGRGGPVPVKMTPCVVCGTYVVPGKSLSSTSMRGEPIFFCSEKCRAEYRER